MSKYIECHLASKFQFCWKNGHFGDSTQFCILWKTKGSLGEFEKKYIGSLGESDTKNGGLLFFPIASCMCCLQKARCCLENFIWNVKGHHIPAGSQFFNVKKVLKKVRIFWRLSKKRQNFDVAKHQNFDIELMFKFQRLFIVGKHWKCWKTLSSFNMGSLIMCWENIKK